MLVALMILFFSSAEDSAGLKQNIMERGIGEDESVRTIFTISDHFPFGPQVPSQSICTRYYCL